MGGVDGRTGKDSKIFFLGISRWDSVLEVQSNCKTFLLRNMMRQHQFRLGILLEAWKQSTLRNSSVIVTP